MKNKIIGQQQLSADISRIFEIFSQSQGFIRPHFILAGESGSGKTHSIESLCLEHKLPLMTINAAQITAEGHSGNSLSKALSSLRNSGGKPCVVFIDEWDKLYVAGNNNSEPSTPHQLAVQNEFLKIVESKETAVFGDYGKYVSVPVDKVLFVFAGAFNGECVNLDRLRELGVKTEFLGRVSLVYNTKKLTASDLKEILRNSLLLRMYLKLFENVQKDKVIAELESYIDRIYEFNTLGARIINTMLHSYFIRGSLEEVPMEEVAFTKKLNFHEHAEASWDQ